MAQTAGGDTDAFEQIVLRHQALVWRVVFRFVGNPADAQDVVQTVFLKLFEAAPQYRPTALLKTYLFRIVNTTCIDHVRKKRPLMGEDTDEMPDSAPSAIDSIILRERDRLIRRAINKLPLRQRSAIIHKYEAGMSVREIAGIIKTTEKGVERLLAHGRKFLAEQLKTAGVNNGGGF
jgi:RNA polymerase sigma-70 factor (ECF subfamily)